MIQKRCPDWNQIMDDLASGALKKHIMPKKINFWQKKEFRECEQENVFIYMSWPADYSTILKKIQPNVKIIGL